MDINEVSDVYAVIRELKSRVLKTGCKEGKGFEENCKFVFEDLDDWCNTCVLECATYFLEQSIKINEQVIINEEKYNESRQTNQGTNEIPDGNGSSRSKS